MADLESLLVEADDAHHLASVLRLRPGEAVGATDGRGRSRMCSWPALGSGARSPGAVALVADGPVVAVAPRVPALTVAFAPVKGDRPEWTVQKLTEIGVDRIVIVTAARSVVKWDAARAGAHLERLRRVARAAVMQSHQVWLPTLEGVADVADLARSADAGWALADTGAEGSNRSGGVTPPSWDGVHTVLVGPEGGWTDAERRLLPGRVSLGPSVLRAETAAVAAGVLLCALRSGLVTLPGPRV